MDKRLKQYGTLIAALALGGGFALSGIASYSALNSGIGGSGDRQQFNASMPSSNYQEEPYSMSMREQRVLAYNNDVAFVNAYYGNEEQRQQLRELKSLSNSFDGRVYVSVANSSAPSDIKINYGIVNYPAIVVMGANGATQPDNMTVSAVSEAICASFRSLGDQSAQCL